jgi:tripartite ATP-independent transporter DctM subunit
MFGLSPFEIGVIGATALAILAVSGMRIAFAAALVGTLGLCAMMGWDAGIRTAGVIPHAKTASYTLSVLPMFILIGYLAYHAGITQAAFEACRRWFGWLPGGLAVGTIFAVAGFSAVSGASTAAAAVFARVAIPEMLKAGYDRKLSAGVVAAGATLDSLIPPSALLVIYGIIVEESIGKLLIAGFVPGLFSALVYTAIVVFMCWRNPALGRPISGFTWRQRIESVPGTLPILLVIGIIFTSMLYGWATPTEAGALGAFCVFVLALANRMSFENLKTALIDTAKLTAMIFTIIWGVLIFVRFLGFAGLPETFASWVVDLKVPPLVVLLAIYAIYFVLGMFMDAIGMMLLTLPIFFPVIVKLGYDPIWFGIVLVKLCGIGFLTPPVGLCCYVVNGVRPDIPLSDVFKGIWPFVVADIITLAFMTAFPEIVTFILDFGGD